MSTINFTIDGKACKAKPGQTIVEAAKDNGIYIPTLCHFEGLKPAGTCRICTVKVGGRNMSACTTPVTEGMVVENKTADLEDYRKAIIEMLFVEGNHMCPTCEKSGNCELQALGYRYLMMAPRFPFLFPKRTLDASIPKIVIERNRCVQCLRCVRGITTPDGKRIFGVVNRGGHVEVTVDKDLAATMTDEMAKKAMDLCPVGAILKKEVGFAIPIGKRKFDSKPIGSEIEKA
ncbi:MAG: 2Fe-2S iron-sulfur cluster-binding protein [Spirochaetota bacterium]|nr:2Fe-2S iron-sulfur cluster-binding protein [Spirochaetota bacterium]